MKGTWKCPSFCDETQIQNPVVYYEIINRMLIRTPHCPLCGKQMGYYIECIHQKLAGFIITKEKNEVNKGNVTKKLPII